MATTDSESPTTDAKSSFSFRAEVFSLRAKSSFFFQIKKYVFKHYLLYQIKTLANSFILAS